MSQGAMGLRGDPKKAIPHSILDLAQLPTFEAYCTSLERGPRRTMLQTHSAVEKNGILHSSRASASHLRLEHLQVAIAHEKRVYTNRVQAGIAGLGRFVGAKLMTGIVDEYRGQRGELLAWSQSVAKGSTLRGMWYYARPEVDKMHIWFFNARLQVLRAQAKGLRYVDVGPSVNETVKTLKERYGFAHVTTWRDLQGYEGEWQSLSTISVASFSISPSSSSASSSSAAVAASPSSSSFSSRVPKKKNALLANATNPCESTGESPTNDNNNNAEEAEEEGDSSKPNVKSSGGAQLPTSNPPPARHRPKKTYHRLEDSPVLVATETTIITSE